MDAARCISFLSAHQPLPPDAELSADLVNELDAARRWLAAHPLPEALPLLLRVFGEGDGCGVYPMIEATLGMFPHESVVAELAAVLAVSPAATRYWALQLASTFPSQRLVKPLSDLLPLLDDDARYAALTALEAIGGEDAQRSVAGWAGRETQTELRDLISDIVNR